MSTVDSAFLIIAAVCLSLFFLAATSLVIYTWVVFHSIVKKAEFAIESVENVSKVIREVSKSSSALSLIKFLKFIKRLGS
jgi:hypothetical protein